MTKTYSFHYRAGSYTGTGTVSVNVAVGDGKAEARRKAAREVARRNGFSAHLITISL